MTILPAPLPAILDLRHAVLRAGLPRETAIFPGDELPTSLHLAAYDDTNTVIGCLTLHLNTWENRPAYQLRGMATAPTHRRQGLGRALLTHAENHVLTTNTRTLWCNARTPAVPFYTAMNWQVVSDEFQIPSAGPHVKMLRVLDL